VVGARTSDGDERRDAPPGPLRQCALSRAVKPQDELIRFVAAPDGAIVPDLARRLPGRGVWIDATRSAVALAVRQRAFQKSLRRNIAVAEDLPEAVERLLVARLVGALAMANKAGLVIAGFVRVAELLRDGRAFALLHAAEAAAGGSGRLDRMFKALRGASAAEAHTVRELSSAELSLAIGQPTVVHAAAAEGGASRGLLQLAGRLRRYRRGGASPPSAAPITGPDGRAIAGADQDPGTGPDTGPDTGPETGPDAGPDDTGRETGRESPGTGTDADTDTDQEAGRDRGPNTGDA